MTRSVRACGRSTSSSLNAARSARRLDRPSASAAEGRSSDSCLRSASVAARPARGPSAAVPSARGGDLPSRRRARRSSTTARRGGSSARGRSAAGDALHARRQLSSPRSSRDRTSKRSSPCLEILSVRGAGETCRPARWRTSWGGSGVSKRSRCSSGAAPSRASADCRSWHDARTSAAASSRTTPFRRTSASSTTSTPPARLRTPAPVRADGLEPGAFG